MFPNAQPYFSGGSNRLDPGQDDIKARQAKIREMLKEFSKKKDQVIKDQIKQRIGDS